MKTVYSFSNLIKIQKFTAKYKDLKIKNFHRIKIKDSSMTICIKNKKILILKEFRFGLNKCTWGLPGGFVDDKESPLIAARREIFEELGIKVKKIYKLYSFIRNGNYYCGKDHVFYTYLDSKINIMLEKNTKIKWIPINQIIKFIKKGEFKTLGLITALMFFYNTINR
jgi:8-oxo-dGTP pyrophosphatase MutT (NUDIX family)